MSDNKETGGPAFPKTGSYNDTASSEYDSLDQEGMSLRDYFAAKAMQAICTHNDTWGIAHDEDIADRAYLIADAMLEARKQ